MKLLFFVFLMVLNFSEAPLVQSHAVITRSSLQNQPIKANQASKVSLIFNSDIETALSTIQLVSKGDRKEPVEFTRGRGRGEIVVDLPPLPPGEYALQYKVFAADGHLTEDIVKFVIGGE